MTTIATFASKNPGKPAVIYGPQERGGAERVESYGELEERSRRIGVLLRSLGLGPGDGVAVLMANDDEFMDIFWAAHRVGLYFTPVNWHLQVDEVEYIVDNCDAKVLVAHQRFGDLASKATANNDRLVKTISVGGEISGFESLESLLSDVPKEVELGEEFEGSIMLYSSGTTGRPKGVRRPLAKVPAGDPLTNLASLAIAGLFGLVEDDRYLSPAPLYHAAPLVYTAAQQRIGATSIILRRFDPEEALRMIDRYRVTTSQWVPAHFHRLVRLPQEAKEKYDVSSLRVAVHAAAPCPIPLKEQMIEWWGDAIVEYYAGTEGGGTMIRADEWMDHKGSVGRHMAQGTIHILDDQGKAITDAGAEGNIFFEAPDDEASRFRYHKDEEKTLTTYRGKLFTLGDVGYLDADGYLYLTDRQSHMIISGGVNIYPQETENYLIMHPEVDDVAVIGVPSADMGEEVKAVVIPVDGREAGLALAQELIEYCRDGIAHYKCPRSIDFVDELPRTETGKMAKRKLRDLYWKDADGRI